MARPLLGLARAQEQPQPRAVSSDRAPATTTSQAQVVQLARAQQKAIELKTEKVELGPIIEVLSAPGQITPDENHYAYITPRASGVVRSVAAQIGQEVKAGDLLAVIDSSEVAQARLGLVTRTQELSLARAQDEWEAAIYRSTQELIERLKAGDNPDQIHQRFENRPIGEVREKLVSAYAAYRLAKVTLDRNKALQEKNAISLSQFQQVRAESESASAVYEGLMDRMGFEATQAYRKTNQARRQAETAVRVAIEHLRVLGAPADDAEVLAAEKKEKPQPHPPITLADAIPTGGFKGDGPGSVLLDNDRPVSTYELRAPFDGTILERGVIVPGVAVDTSHQLFTMANLSTVWVEANVHESDFGRLIASREGRVTVHTRAYSDRVFSGKVLYTGDLVDQKSRMVKLLASVPNPDRLLKPGMFVEVEIESRQFDKVPIISETALLTEGKTTFVFVQTGDEKFERRIVAVGEPRESRVPVRSGLTAGESVVTAGAYKLKAEAIRRAAE